VPSGTSGSAGIPDFLGFPGVQPGAGGALPTPATVPSAASGEAIATPTTSSLPETASSTGIPGFPAGPFAVPSGTSGSTGVPDFLGFPGVQPGAGSALPTPTVASGDAAAAGMPAAAVTANNGLAGLPGIPVPSFGAGVPVPSGIFSFGQN
jgi:hypothetical protein